MTPMIFIVKSYIYCKSFIIKINNNFNTFLCDETCNRILLTQPK